MFISFVFNVHNVFMNVFYTKDTTKPNAHFPHQVATFYFKIRSDIGRTQYSCIIFLIAYKNKFEAGYIHDIKLQISGNGTRPLFVSLCLHIRACFFFFSREHNHETIQMLSEFTNFLTSVLMV